MHEEPGAVPYDRMTRPQKVRRFVRRNPTMVVGGLLLMVMVLV